MSKRIKTEIFNDNFQNYKRYGIPKAQLDAENAFLQRQSQQKEDNADESLVATEEYR